MDNERILSATITHPKNIEQDPHHQGVALIVMNEKRDVLLVQQRHDDPMFGRKQGQWNVVTETREDGELVRETVRRALLEELGFSFDRFMVLPGTYRETNNIYIARLGYQYFFRCIVLKYLGYCGGDPNTYFQSHDGEIAAYLWVPLGCIDYYDIEHGARMVLEHYREELVDFL